MVYNILSNCSLFVCIHKLCLKYIALSEVFICGGFCSLTHAKRRLQTTSHLSAPLHTNLYSQTRLPLFDPYLNCSGTNKSKTSHNSTEVSIPTRKGGPSPSRRDLTP